MTSHRYCSGWPLAVALAASVLALPSRAAPLTLEEALRLADEQAPSLTAQAQKLQAAQSAALPAGELPDPKLLLGVQNFPVSGSNRGTLDHDFMTMQMLGVRQDMFSADKRQARREVAEAAIDTASAEGRIERLTVRQSTAQAWIGTYSLVLKEAQFQAFFHENRLLAEAVRAQIASGRAQPADAVVPRQEAAQLEEQQDELRRQRTRAQAALRRWIGPAAEATPAGNWPQWPVSANGYAHTLEHHPLLAAFTPRAREAEARIREAEADKQPDWSWEVDYQRRGREFGDMLSVQFSVDLPLFTGSRQTPRIAARQAQLKQLQAERDAAAREHSQQLEDALADYQHLDRSLRRSQDSLVPLAEEKARLSLASYRAGKGELTRVIAARRELIETRLQQIDLKEQRALLSASLYFAYGEGRP